MRSSEHIKLINTNSWQVSNLTEIGKGITDYPDLDLLQIISHEDGSISVFTVIGENNEQLIKRTYSDQLKYYLQNASIKFKNDQSLIL